MRNETARRLKITSLTLVWLVLLVDAVFVYLDPNRVKLFLIFAGFALLFTIAMLRDISFEARRSKKGDE